MGDISDNFSRHEFACSCGCGFEAVDKELLDIAEQLREKIGSFTPNCACRCQKHNRKIGSRDTSFHVKGMAMDIPIDNEEKKQEIYQWLDKWVLFDRGGLGIYSWGLHIDVRRRMARWADG